jgi:hypothetical protein
MTLQENATPGDMLKRKFTTANIQKIKDWVAEGISREEIAKSLHVTVGSLQVTCSRLGISLRRRDASGPGRPPYLPRHPPIAGQRHGLSDYSYSRMQRHTADDRVTPNEIRHSAAQT